MKRNIGPKPTLYPMPVIVVGAMNGDEPTWTLVAHTGIPSHSKIATGEKIADCLSFAKARA